MQAAKNEPASLAATFASLLPVAGISARLWAFARGTEWRRPIDKSEQLQRILELPLLREIPEETRQRIGGLILSLSDPLTLSDGDALMRQDVVGLGPGAGFVLLEGTVEVRKEGAAGITLPAPALLGEMQQFNAQSLRTATVLAKGACIARKFSWQELYRQAKQDLDASEQAMLIDSIERVVWERFDRDTLMDIALFRGLSDRLRLRACVTLQWLTEQVTLAGGETLFQEDEMCGAVGYLLTQGTIVLSKLDHKPVNVAAPNILGVMPHFDPNMKWTATATAEGAVEVLKFSWQRYVIKLKERLSEEDLQEFNEGIEAASTKHFLH